MRGIFTHPIRLPFISVNIKRGGGSNYNNVADGMQAVCAIAPLKETSHSVVLSADVVPDLECMPALNVMCVKVKSCDNDTEYQSCNSCVNDCMVTEVDAGNDDDDDESTVIVADNADQLLVNDMADSNEQLIKAQHENSTLASWTSAGVRTCREIQQDVQSHAVPRDTTAWSSVAPGHSAGRVGLTGGAKRDDWSLAIHAGLRTLTAWTTGGAVGDVDRSARRQRRPRQAGRELHDRLACSLEKGGRLGSAARSPRSRGVHAPLQPAFEGQALRRGRQGDRCRRRRGRQAV